MPEQALSEFWDVFRGQAEELAKEEPLPGAMDALLAALRRLDPRLCFHVGLRDDGQDLLLSAEGNLDMAPVIEQMIRSAPRLDRWGYVLLLDSSLLLGERNHALFPQDDNGDVLYRMAVQGDALWKARNVEFAVVFPSKRNAESFIASLGHPWSASDVSDYDGAEGHVCQVVVTSRMAPTHSEIARTEEQIGALAEKFGGRNDGWGCFQQEPAPNPRVQSDAAVGGEGEVEADE